MKKLIYSFSIVCLIFMINSTYAHNSELTVYSAMDESQAKAILKAFSEKYPSIKVNSIIGSTETMVTRVLAEGNNPRADIIMGIAVSSLLVADKKHLLMSYKPKYYDDISMNMKDTSQSPIWTGIDAWASAICFNTQEAEKLGLKKPSTWKELTDSSYSKHILMPSPLSSGTAFLALNTWITLWGEQEAWKYMTDLDKNIISYTSSGSAPSRQVAMGEAVIGISYATPCVKALNEGAPVEVIIPEEGLGWDIEGVSILKGAKNLDNAKLMADFLSSREVALITAKFLPITPYKDITELPKNYPANEKDKLLNLDFRYLSDKRDEIIGEWQRRFGSFRNN